MARATQSAVYYLHPDGWSNNPDNARGRIRSRVSTRTQVVQEFWIDEPDGKGGWRERATPGASRIDDGWQWFAWRALRAGVALVMFQGVRPLDPAMAASLCDGIVLHDPSGAPLESPADAGLIFALTPSDAQLFRSRAVTAGGVISAIRPDMGHAGRAAAQLAQEAAHAAQLAQQAMGAIQGGGAAARTTIQQMDDLLRDAWECRTRGRDALDDVERFSSTMHTEGVGADEAVSSAALAVAGHGDWQRIEDALSQIIGAQREAALQIAHTESGPGVTPLVAPFDQWHGHIAARLRAQGQTARVENGELVIDLPAGTVRIGQTARLDLPS